MSKESESSSHLQDSDLSEMSKEGLRKRAKQQLGYTRNAPLAYAAILCELVRRGEDVNDLLS
jgi:hypothetical protein